MVAALVLSGVVMLGFAIGAGTSARLYLTAVLGLVGLAGMIVAFAELVVLPNPTGEGWSDRYQVFGHWVPIWQCNLMEASLFSWMLAVAGGAFLARVWRHTRPLPTAVD